MIALLLSNNVIIILKKRTRQWNRQSGQIVLVVLLLVMVGMSLGISIFLDSLSETNLTVNEELSEKAFNAAEAAVETTLLAEYSQLLDPNFDGSFTLNNGIAVDVDVEYSSVIEAQSVPENSVLAVNTSDPNGVTSLLLKWGNSEVGNPQNPGSCNPASADPPPALYLERWYDNGSSIEIDRRLYRANGCPTNPSISGDPDVYDAHPGTLGYLSQIETDFSISSDDIVVRIRPLFNDADIYIEGVDAVLPAQVANITATPTVEDGSVVRSIEVLRYYSDLPDIFDYVLFSGVGVVK